MGTSEAVGAGRTYERLRVVLLGKAGGPCTRTLGNNAGKGTLIAVSVVLDETKDRQTRIKLAGHVTNGVHGREQRDGCTVVVVGRCVHAGRKDEGSESLSDELLLVEGCRSRSTLGFSSREPFVNFPGNARTDDLAKNRREALHVVVRTAVEVGDRGEGRVHGGARDRTGDGESSANLHEITIGGKNPGDKEEGSEDLGDVSCKDESERVRFAYRRRLSSWCRSLAAAVPCEILFSVRYHV